MASVPTIPATAPPSLTDTYGAVLLSSFIALSLYGVTVHQTVRYYRLYPKDVKYLKILVAALLMADSFHSVTLIHLNYHYLIINYFSPLSLLLGVWSIQVMSLSTGAVVVLAQSFYARRIYLVDRRYKPVVTFIALLILTEIAFIVSATYHALHSKAWTDFAPHLWQDTALFAIATVADLLLMIVFVIILRKSRTPFRGTRVTLDTLALYAVVGTLLNTVLTTPAFITSLTSKGTFIYIAMAIPTTKIYANSVLAFLNCRASLSENMGTGGNTSLNLSVLKRKGRNASHSTGGSLPVPHISTSPSAVLDIKMPGRSTVTEDTASSLEIEGPSRHACQAACS